MFLFYLILEKIMCTKTCTKMVKRDYAGFGGIPLDSLKKHEIIALKYSDKRAIPTPRFEYSIKPSNARRSIETTSSKSSSKIIVWQ
jgi:hypothetical protein